MIHLGVSEDVAKTTAFYQKLGGKKVYKNLIELANTWAQSCPEEKVRQTSRTSWRTAEATSAAKAAVASSDFDPKCNNTVPTATPASLATCAIVVSSKLSIANKAR